MSRVAIAGGPKTGKTTLAPSFSGTIIHTDDYIKKDIRVLMDDVRKLKDNYVVEGTLVPNLIREFMYEGPYIPFDRLVVLTKPRIELTNRQWTLTGSIHKVLGQIIPFMEKAGVKVEYRNG